MCAQACGKVARSRLNFRIGANQQKFIRRHPRQFLVAIAGNFPGLGHLNTSGVFERCGIADTDIGAHAARGVDAFGAEIADDDRGGTQCSGELYMKVPNRARADDND